MSIPEHTWAIRFFVEYSNDVHEYRMHLLSPAGIPVMVQNIKTLHADLDNIDRTKQDIQDLCLVFARISTFDWYLPILVQCNICPTLVSLLVYVALLIIFMVIFNPHVPFSFFRSFSQRNINREWSWVEYDLIRVLQYLGIHGGESGQQAILNATTDDLRQVLPYVGNSIKQFLGDKLAVEAENIIVKVWK
jgi:hypothetical protein